jgi:hypothetical protein
MALRWGCTDTHADARARLSPLPITSFHRPPSLPSLPSTHPRQQGAIGRPQSWHWWGLVLIGLPGVWPDVVDTRGTALVLPPFPCLPFLPHRHVRASRACGGVKTQVRGFYWASLVSKWLRWGIGLCCLLFVLAHVHFCLHWPVLFLICIGQNCVCWLLVQACITWRCAFIPGH